MNVPNELECLALLRKNNTPERVVAHCMAVRGFAVSCAERLRDKGISVNILLVAAAALLHDIEKLKPNHVVAGHDYVKAAGYPEVAMVIKKHGLENLGDRSYHPLSIEEKLVFYADKHIMDDTIVPLEQRFGYIRKRYNYPSIEHEFAFTKEIEAELVSLLGEAP